MKIAVFWRAFRNVEFQKMLTPENVKDDAYEEAYLHSEALKEAGYESVLIEWKDTPIETYKELEEKGIDLVFNASSARELVFLESFKIPYVGSSAYTAGMDKGYRKIIASYYGVPTPKFLLAKGVGDIPQINIDYPLFVKPLEGRGSAGIDETNIIESYEDLPAVVEKITKGIGQTALIEECIEGREFTVGIIGYKNPEVLPILEIKLNDAKTNTYEHKMFDNETIICPMELPKDVEENIKEVSLKAYRELGIRDFGRLDFILDENNIPYFLEVNIYAGLTMPSPEDEVEAHYGYMGYMAKEIGYSRSQFLDKIIKSAMERYKL